MARRRSGRNSCDIVAKQRNPVSYGTIAARPAGRPAEIEAHGDHLK